MQKLSSCRDTIVKYIPNSWSAAFEVVHPRVTITYIPMSVVSVKLRRDTLIDLVVRSQGYHCSISGAADKTVQ